MKYAVRCETGKVRSSNQDSYLAENGVFAVADGMGGHCGGETASRIAVESMRNALASAKPALPRLKLAVEAANRRIFETGRETPALFGMGTTLSLFWVDNTSAFIAHVGDSRIYRFRNGILMQLTDDHSLVWEMIADGKLTKEEARVNPYRNIITRAVGTDSIIEADYLCTDILPGDRFLLCSDGLCGLVEDEAIADVLRLETETDAAAARLLQLAMDAGGSDNITVLLLDGGECP